MNHLYEVHYRYWDAPYRLIIGKVKAPNGKMAGMLLEKKLPANYDLDDVKIVAVVKIY